MSDVELFRSARAIAQHREVYFLLAKDAGLVKIGVANRSCIDQRMRDLAMMSPVPLTLVGIIRCDQHGATEAALHIRFADDRRHGEWFYFSERLCDFIMAKAWMPERIKRLQRDLDCRGRTRGRPRKDAS